MKSIAFKAVLTVAFAFSLAQASAPQTPQTPNSQQSTPVAMQIATPSPNGNNNGAAAAANNNGAAAAHNNGAAAAVNQASPQAIASIYTPPNMAALRFINDNDLLEPADALPASNAQVLAQAVALAAQQAAALAAQQAEEAKQNAENN